MLMLTGGGVARDQDASGATEPPRREHGGKRGVGRVHDRDVLRPGDGSDAPERTQHALGPLRDRHVAPARRQPALAITRFEITRSRTSCSTAPRRMGGRMPSRSHSTTSSQSTASDTRRLRIRIRS